jgi:hypothetical protein
MSILKQSILGATALAGAVGCAHFQGEPRALYVGPARPPAETALLSGYVAKVDDVDVSHMGGPFTVLPGCHVITSRDKLGDNSPSGAWSAVMPPLTFPLRMRAGHVYEIQAQRQGSGSETANLKMHAVELDGSGKKLGEVPASHGKADIEACRAWEAEQEAQAQPTSQQKGAQPVEAAE